MDHKLIHGEYQWKANMFRVLAKRRYAAHATRLEPLEVNYQVLWRVNHQIPLQCLSQVLLLGFFSILFLCTLLTLIKVVLVTQMFNFNSMS